MRRALTLLLALLAVAGAAGCGADDEPSAERPPDAPELTVPRTETTELEETPTAEEPTTTTETVPPPATTEEEPAPPATTTSPPDTPTSDTPPPPDSPAERFEDFCNENPGACG
ncbi:MAG TPA: hypothetical protein VGF25_11130 [Thermoleophilaceae bacterium]